MVDTFVQLQDEVQVWTEHNFPDTTPTQALLGVVEEFGELAEAQLKMMELVGKFCHAHLKAEQKIRKNEDHEKMKKDSIGDIIIFLAHYCIKQGYDLDSIVNLTWDHVKKRDWKKFPKNGVSE